MQGEDDYYDIDELLGNTFGEAQIRKIEKKGLKKAGLAERDELAGAPDEYGLEEMSADLIQSDEERILSNTRDNSLTCQVISEKLISACAQIQSDPIYWTQKEDTRSTQVRTILRNNNIFVSDQTRYGHAKDSSNPGEVDLMVMKNSRDPLTIIEAMNINSVNTVYIQEHLNKLLDDYNPNGLQELFLVGYVQKAKEHFQTFWARYVEFINGTNAGRFLFKSIEVCETKRHFIKHALVEYICDGAVFKVHHICMRAGD